MTVGVMALAVPLSSNFAGEFLILAGVFQQGWGWAVVGAVAIVLAAMYMLRLISAVLHRGRRAGRRRRGARPARRRARGRRAARRDPARPLGLAECDQRPFVRRREQCPDDGAGGRAGDDPQAARRLVRALAVALDARGSGAADAGRRLLAAGPRGAQPSAVVCGAGFAAGLVFAILVDEKSPHGAAIIADSIYRDRWAATAQVIIAACGLVAVLVAYRERMREENIAEYYVLLAAAGAGMAFFVQAASLITLFLGLEWFSIALYVLCAIDIDLVGSLEAGLKYLVVGAVGSATLLFGSALVYGATGELSFDKIATAGVADDSLLVLGLAMMLAGFAFKASAAPFHMWTPDAYQGAPTPVTTFMSSATKVAALVVMERVLVTAFPRRGASLDVGGRRDRDLLARGRQHRGARPAERQAAARLLVGLARRLHADRDRRGNEIGARALMYYLIPYAAMSIGAFGVIAARERELGVPVTLENLAGFGWERPFFGVSMWVFMLGFLGFPLTGGFWGKIYVFSPPTSAAGGG